MYYNTGFITSNGMPQFMIYNEIFHITGSNTISKI